MKKTLSAVMLLLMSIVFANTTEAKIKVAPKLYIFGFSASFKNAIVYLTNLQELADLSIAFRQSRLTEDLIQQQLREAQIDRRNPRRPHGVL